MIEDFAISAQDRCRVKRTREMAEREAREFVARGFNIHDNPKQPKREDPFSNGEPS